MHRQRLQVSSPLPALKPNRIPCGRNGFFQHLLVQLDAYLADMSGLFLAQQVACAADIKIVTGQAEPCPERVERLHDIQAAACGFERIWFVGKVR